MKSNQFYPNQRSEDPYERSLAVFVKNLQSAYRGDGKMKLTKEIIEACEKIPDWTWGESDYKNKTYLRVLDVENFVSINGRFPSKRSKKPEEKTLGHLVKKIKYSYRKKKGYKITPKIIEVCERTPGWQW